MKASVRISPQQLEKKKTHRKPNRTCNSLDTAVPFIYHPYHYTNIRTKVLTWFLASVRKFSFDGWRDPRTTALRSFFYKYRGSGTTLLSRLSLLFWYKRYSYEQKGYEYAMIRESCCCVLLCCDDENNLKIHHIIKGYAKLFIFILVLVVLLLLFSIIYINIVQNNKKKEKI